MRRSDARSQSPSRYPGTSRAYRPAPGPRQGWWGAVGLGFALGVTVVGLVAAPSGFGRAADGHSIGLDERESRPEVPPEWRIERRALSFDHMFRSER